MFLDFLVSPFFFIPAEDGIFDQHQVSSIQHLPGKSNRFKHIEMPIDKNLCNGRKSFMTPN